MRHLNCLTFLACVGLGLMTVGCNAFATNPGPSIQQALANPKNPPSGNTFTVEIHSEGAKTLTRQVTLGEEPYVQQALQKSGAYKKFGRMNVEVVRTSPQGNKHKMVVVFDPNKRQVEPQNNYFLFPGDVIVVTEDPSSIVDDMMNRTLGPMGNRYTRHVSG